jgi:hypothetical protein
MMSVELRRSFIQQFLDITDKKIIEMGVLDSPTFTKNESNIFYMDWFSKDELYLAHYQTAPSRAENLLDVDWVVKEKNFAKQISDTFDLFIANHVIEHIPDTIRWLQNISSILNQGGWLFLAIPHKEYTFDKIKSLTTLAQIIRNYDEDLESPNVYHVFEHYHLMSLSEIAK